MLSLCVCPHAPNLAVMVLIMETQCNERCKDSNSLRESLTLNPKPRDRTTREVASESESDCSLHSIQTSASRVLNSALAPSSRMRSHQGVGLGLQRAGLGFETCFVFSIVGFELGAEARV